MTFTIITTTISIRRFLIMNVRLPWPYHFRQCGSEATKGVHMRFEPAGYLGKAFFGSSQLKVAGIEISQIICWFTKCITGFSIFSFFTSRVLVDSSHLIDLL